MNILFVTSTRIGDAVLSTALLSHLVSRHPNASITVACGVLPAPLFQDIPCVRRVIPIEKRRFAAHWITLWSDVVKTSWDLVIDLRASALAWTILSRERRTLRTNDSDTNIHRVTELGGLLDLDPPPDPKLWLSDQADNQVADTIPEGTPVIGLGVTANWLPKIWPAENFVALVQKITGATGIIPGARVAVFGAANERSIAQPVLEGLGEGKCIDLVGKIDLQTVAACLSRCAIFVGNDSGLMHMSAAVSTPTVGLFGPSPPARYGPWGDHCIVVESSESYRELVGAPSFDHRSSENLMAGLSVEAVYEAARAIYRNVGKDC